MSRGSLRIYLGAAPGVGKTYAMLDEGWRRASRGTEVVVGYVETHGRPNTVRQIRDLEVMPRQVIRYRDQDFEEMDVDAILARQPEVVLVDELAHTNVPGSRNAKRYADVQELLDAGIDVISTVNVQHLESLNDVVESITGVKQQETIPDALVRSADQIELVDMAPEALRRRMAHGNIYAVDKVDAALGNYFRVGNLGALRELALLWVADRVDESLQGYMEAHGITGTWETRERVVVAVTGSPSGEHLIRRAARIAARSKGDLLGVHVRADDGLVAQPPVLLEAHTQLLEDLGGQYHEVIGTDIAEALTSFARAERATQLVMGASHRSRWAELTRGSVINSVTRGAQSYDVHVISSDAVAETRLPARRLQAGALPPRRQAAGWIIAIVGLPLLTVILAAIRTSFGLPGDLMVFTLLVVAASAVGGRWPGLVAAVAGALLVNWYFTMPYHTLTIATADNTAAVIGFIVVSLVVSVFVTQASHRAAVAGRASAEAEALARIAAGLVGEDDPLPSMVDRLRSTFGLTGARVELADPDTGEWRVDTVSRDTTSADESDLDTLSLGEHARLVLQGAPLAADDRRILQAFVAQLASALERRALRVQAAQAAIVSESDALRTALLRAVSHDLRTPLASIKASVSSLLQKDVDWPAETTDEFLHTIDEETDRLNNLVGNLLDMSRLETGALQISPQAVGYDEIVAAAVASLSDPIDRLRVKVPETLPLIVADPPLLERAVANVVANALRHSPADQPVRIEAAAVGERVNLQVIDQGPGVSEAKRNDLFQPFQRLGDTSTPDGVGLGLAVSHGFVQAMGGQIEAEDTPGGGLTMTISMKLWR